jgi:tetratricopeptide (TPR) repeat protein
LIGPNIRKPTISRSPVHISNCLFLLRNDKNSSKEKVRYHKQLSGKISVAFAYLHSKSTDTEKTFSYWKAAMENLSEDDPFWFSWGWYSIGIAETVGEHFNDSIEAYEKALAYDKKSGNIFLISTIVYNLASLEVRMGLYTSAYRKCSDLMTFMKDSQNTFKECFPEA